MIIAVIFIIGAYVRLFGLGSKSLWADELCTWHVSRMPLIDSLFWGPELTKPPLYQLILRLVTAEAHPEEWTLRIPAFLAGILVIPAALWLGKLAGGWPVGAALAGLLAGLPFHIHHSQDARPYSMLVLGCIVSTAFWYRVVARRRNLDAVAYVLAAAITFHAHYLSLLTFAAHGAWALLVACTDYTRRSWRPFVALGCTALLGVPMVWHFLRNRHSTFQGLDWIKPPTWSTAFDVLAQITFGYMWIAILFLSIVYWSFRAMAATRSAPAASEPGVRRTRTTGPSRCASEPSSQPSGGMAKPSAAMPLQTDATHLRSTPPSEPGAQATGSEYAEPSKRRNVQSSPLQLIEHPPRDLAPDPLPLLLCWIAFAWFGLLVISWVRHPAMVDRYAIPASVPALLLPLIVAARIWRRAPLLLMAAFMIYSAVIWVHEGTTVEPGFRELVAFLNETVNPETEAVVLIIDNKTHPSWDDAERLPFVYYPLAPPISLLELHLAPDGATVENPEVLHDPRGLWIVVLWADPFPPLAQAGRNPVPIQIEDRRFTQLRFEAYRLVRVTPR